jgi:S-adenosyl methyltransferase
MADDSGPVSTRDGETAAAQPGIDVTRPHPARIYDYFLGGKDNFAADRETAGQVLRNWPTVRTAARENRAFLNRAVRYLAAEAGIRQFLDIGSGLPTASNVHEVAQSIAPECRVVYADNDPIVLAHARALLASHPDGQCAYLDGDLRQPERILHHPALARTLDLSQPVALMLVALLHFVPDEDQPRRIVQTLLEALPAGSYLTASHVTDVHNEDGLAGAGRAYQDGGLRGALRTPDEFAGLAFAGLDMIEPGVTLVSEWRPDAAAARPLAAEVNMYGGVARKR